MTRIRESARALLLGSTLGIAVVAWNGCVAAAVKSASSGSDSSAVVIHGSDEATAPPSSGDDPSPVVLRGEPPSPVLPAIAPYPCSPGYLYDPSDGCVAPGYAYEPDDYGYWPWPYYGYGWNYPGNRRHRFRHGFAGRAGRAAAVRFGHSAVNGFGHGFARIGGFGRR